MNVCMRYKMIQYERSIYISEVTGIPKSNESKQCMICHYWCFLNKGFNYGSYVCNGCLDLSMTVYDLKDFMILNIKGVDYRCFVSNMSKNTAIKLLNNSQLYGKGTLSI